MQIIRYPSIGESQLFGCVAAFTDSLAGELNAAAAALRRLEGRSKGAAFAFEMALDRRRYGAQIVLDRWLRLVETFGAHLSLTRRPEIVSHAKPRVVSASNVLDRVNRLIDGSESYSSEVVEACLLAFRAVESTFAEEFGEAAQSAKLGPMLPEDYTSARRIFAEDLAAR
ncbi:MAG: hypothetical protein ACLQVN_18690 [Bryobacteraceae bacterium]